LAVELCQRTLDVESFQFSHFGHRQNGLCIFLSAIFRRFSRAARKGFLDAFAGE
jgi:hypothetical protein